MILVSKYLLQMQNNIIYKDIKRVCCIIFLNYLLKALKIMLFII